MLFVEKVSFQVKNENKTSLIPVFPLIFKDQYMEIFGQSIQIFEYYSALKNTTNWIWISIFGGKYSNIRIYLNISLNTDLDLMGVLEL